MAAITSGTFYQDTVSYTSSAGATALFQFDGKCLDIGPLLSVGTTLYVFGPTGPSFGLYSVSIDSKEKKQYNASTTVNTYGTLLYFVTGLQDSTHTFELGCDGSGVVGFDYAVAVSGGGGSGVVTGTGTGQTGDGTGTTGTTTNVGVFPTSGTAGANTGGSNGAAGAAIGGTLGAIIGIVSVQFPLISLPCLMSAHISSSPG